MKRKSRAAAAEEVEDAPEWEVTRQARRPAQQERAPRLPVLGQTAGAGGGWVAEEAVTLAAPQVAGITVVDDLAAELERQQHEQQLQLELEEEKDRQRQQEAQRPAKKQRPGAAVGLEALRGIESREQRRAAAKQQLATAAQHLLQDPQKQLPQLKLLLELLRDDDLQVSRLAMLTLLAVFKDLIPAYRIRRTHEEGAEDKLSKEVRALRTYEEGLLDGYHSYLKCLLQEYKSSNAGQAPPQQGRVAVKCMAGLLEAAPHFNYRSDLLQALVACLPHKDEQIRDAALGGLSGLLSSSFGDGEVATEAVQLVADLVRQRNCNLPPSTLDCLHGLRFPDITAPLTATDIKRKKKKKQRDEAAADLESRKRNQTATIEALFEMLFRVLKQCSTSGVVLQSDAAPVSRKRFMRRFPLLFPALRLLSKFVHLIGIEYMQDIAEELRNLLSSNALPPQERLRVLLTAAEMVRSQNNTVPVEHAGFCTELYAALRHIMLSPLLEGQDQPSSKDTAADAASQDEQEQDGLLDAALAADGEAGMKAGEQVCFLATQALSALLLDTRALDAPRQAAFVKRVLATALAAGDTGLTMGLLCLVQRLLRRSRRLQGMLQHEAGGPPGQGHQPEVDDPAEANALASPLWELTLLSQHYHPAVQRSSKELAAGGSAALLPSAGPAAAFAATYSTLTGAFNPPPGQQRIPRREEQRK